MSNPGLSGVLEPLLTWNWEKVALAAIVTLAAANVLIYMRERGKSRG